MNPKLTTLAAAMAISVPAILEAQDNTNRFYVRVDAGPVFIQDLGFRVSTPSQGPFPFTQHFAPGARGDVTLGYNLTDLLAVELETGALWNRSGSDFNVFQIPLLETLVYRAHLKNGWTPYFGAGAGADFAVLNTSIFGANGVPTSTSANDVTFGYQAQAGISYAVSPNAALDLGYKFFGSFEHHWNFGDLRFDSDKIYTHAVLLSFCWKF